MPSFNSEARRRFGEKMIPLLKVVAHTAFLALKEFIKWLQYLARFLLKIPPLSWLIDTIAARLKPLTDNIAHHLHTWRTAWEEQKRQGPVTLPKGKELEFLPAVLEIQESPPSPVGRAVAMTIMAVFTIGLVWSSFGKIDIVAIAQGKIIPSDYSKVIQPLESGVVKAIYVKDGQSVKHGDVLIELDPTQTTADEERASNEHQSARLDAARLRALIAGKRKLDTPKGADPKLVLLQQQMLRDQLAEFLAKSESARLQVEQRRAELEATKVNIQRLEATVPMLNQRADAYKKLAEEKFASQVQYLEIESQRVDKVQELAGQRYKLAQDTAALAGAEHNYQAILSEFKQTKLAELSAVETRSTSLSKDVVKATQRTGLQKLTASIDGVVQQLAVHTIGGVVTPAQQLMVIVPNEHQLEIEAYVENKDIGFVSPDQPVEIKVESFPFTRYGLVNGRVLNVSHDAVPLEKVGLVYSARVLMDKSQMQIEDKLINLTPGMNVTVEIKTGQRRLIEYFLSPLLRYKQESVRER